MYFVQISFKISPIFSGTLANNFFPCRLCSCAPSDNSRLTWWCFDQALCGPSVIGFVVLTEDSSVWLLLYVFFFFFLSHAAQLVLEVFQHRAAVPNTFHYSSICPWLFIWIQAPNDNAQWAPLTRKGRKHRKAKQCVTEKCSFLLIDWTRRKCIYILNWTLSLKSVGKALKGVIMYVWIHAIINARQCYHKQWVTN